MSEKHDIRITGDALSIASVLEIARDAADVSLCPDALEHMGRTRAVVDRAINERTPVYGVTTGLGARANEALDAVTLADFSVRTLRGRAHAVGVPETTEAVRAAMTVRLNTLLAGFSGARPEIARHLAACLNAGLTPVVGSIGSIGIADLIPNATIGLALIGEGEMRARDGRIGPSVEQMRDQGIAPLELAPRDGLAIASNTSVVAGAAALAVFAANTAFEAAQTAAAMSMEGFRANIGPFMPKTLAVKPLPGQQIAGAGLLLRLEGSCLHDPGQARRLQDPLSFRNIPQIHGTVSAALASVVAVTEIEINNASDNPVVLLDSDEIVSCGAYFTAELCNAIEALSRAFVHLSVAQVARISKHLNPVFSEQPAFLAKPESNSNGFAPLMKTAEALVSEILHDAQPVAIWPSISANGVEDCIAGSPTAVRALARIAAYSAKLSAIELIVSCQAVEMREVDVRLGRYLANVLSQVRNVSEPMCDDRPLSKDISELSELIETGRLGLPVSS